MGDYRSALQFHIIALDALNQPDVESERYVAGTWYYNSMPIKQEEEEPRQYLVRVGTLLQKQAIVHYRLSFDYALKGDFESADQEFQNAQNLDPSHQYNNFFIFHIQSIIYFVELEGDTKNWFETQWNDLYLQLQ
jgi:tetratricopeptide (TPR) repeat protein